MKKLINDPQAVVKETLEGFELVHGDLVTIHYGPDYVVRKNVNPNKVALVSGGGSGHEPLHAGFVGVGMLDAAVPGAVFTSPTPDAITDATKAVAGSKGVVHIVKNYTGDVMNFEVAAEFAAAEGIEVRAVVIDDDVAVEDSTWTAGRRGVAGTVLVEKIAGAAAERGDDLDAVVAVATKVNTNMGSMGLALAPCTVPHAGKPSFELAEDEVELGVGIHGEPGRSTIKMASADDLTDLLVEPILKDLADVEGNNVLLFVNGMGGTPESELFIVFRHAAKLLADAGLTLTRSLVGNYTTSLEMQGVSVTILKLDDELTALWDAPASTPAFTRG